MAGSYTVIKQLKEHGMCRYVAFSSKNSCDTENKLVELVLGLTNH